MFAYGYYPAPAAEPVFTEHEQRLADARRIRERELASEDALVTMGVALTEVGLLPFEQTIAEARSARELGVPSVLHTGCNWGSLVTEGIPELDHHGLLGARSGPRPLQHARRARLPPAGRERLQGLLEPGDRAADGHGSPGDPPRARATGCARASPAT